MKLASLVHGRDGALVVVSRDLMRCVAVPHIAHTLQAALDTWADAAPETDIDTLIKKPIELRDK